MCFAEVKIGLKIMIFATYFVNEKRYLWEWAEAILSLRFVFGSGLIHSPNENIFVFIVSEVQFRDVWCARQTSKQNRRGLPCTCFFCCDKCFLFDLDIMFTVNVNYSSRYLSFKTWVVEALRSWRQRFWLSQNQVRLDISVDDIWIIFSFTN